LKCLCTAWLAAAVKLKLNAREKGNPKAGIDSSKYTEAKVQIRKYKKNLSGADQSEETRNWIWKRNLQQTAKNKITKRKEKIRRKNIRSGTWMVTRTEGG